MDTEIFYYGTERNIPVGVILRCELAMHNEQVSKLPCVSLFQIFSTMFMPNII